MKVKFVLTMEDLTVNDNQIDQVILDWESDVDQDEICDDEDTCTDPTDTDQDGVPDCDDLCPDTDPADGVDADGCSVPQLCPCDNDWQNHGAYVTCVVDMAQQLVDDGFIEPGIGQDYVNAAGNSNCGGSHVGTPL